MTFYKRALLLSLLASLAYPASADNRGSIGGLYYKPHTYQQGYGRTNSQAIRQNFGNGSYATNPYFRKDSGIGYRRAPNRILVRPSYSNRMNIRQPRFEHGYKRNNHFSRANRYRQAYQRGYFQGFNDGYNFNERKRTFRVGP